MSCNTINIQTQLDLGPVLACTTEDQLVSGSNPIPDTHMTASTEYSASWAAYYARLNGVNAWLPTQAERDTVPPNFYIQVCYDRKVKELSLLVHVFNMLVFYNNYII